MISASLISLIFPPLCCALHLSVCDSVSYSTVRELTWGPGRVNKQSTSPLRRDGEKDMVERRRRRRALQQQQHPPGGSNETEGKKNWRRNAVSLCAQCKQKSPRPLLGPQAAGSEEEMLSVPEFAPLRRCLGTGGRHHKKLLSSPFRRPVIRLRRKQGEPIHPLHWQYEQVEPTLWCSCCPHR